MKVITLHHPHNVAENDLPKISIALGFFDGVHLGHQQVIQNAVDHAKLNGLKSGVMTFNPHPSVVLSNKKTEVDYLTSVDRKLELFEKLGVDYTFVVRFTSSFAGLDPQQFVDQYLLPLNVVHVTAGFDYTYGKFGRGTMETLPFHSRNRFTSTIVGEMSDDREKISSTRIRQTLHQGKVDEARKLLGYPYQLEGTVIHGDKRGRKIGFPTANIEINSQMLIPATGVYAVRLWVFDQWVDGVCNVGYKPTFKSPDVKELTVEVHLFDFNQNVYGENVLLEWHLRIRSERKFNGIEELVAQIELDKTKALAYFSQL
ncbi:bifunctional riboflavin kinase/FAD synthetase [Jeotgalibacillus sp. S-D1]|uniref:bifunctional riboflavin kinase/FAD synthetase n=1 Tax=Jeotgalibacillus sp. S-D1 TaxID=2552189 RepID=UPI001059BCCA|nr:bifunctional riboflavin kinase/FAD synthetase [Jeotgalibacillus sp. S-D1]TDL35008.1 bifunctional riboflavin kinase/FAD synthetase [Jeotgalibacillus sp. S-D1]